MAGSGIMTDRLSITLGCLATAATLKSWPLS
jgi:hypothetical protein